MPTLLSVCNATCRTRLLREGLGAVSNLMQGHAQDPLLNYGYCHYKATYKKEILPFLSFSFFDETKGSPQITPVQ